MPEVVNLCAGLWQGNVALSVPIGGQFQHTRRWPCNTFEAERGPGQDTGAAESLAGGSPLGKFVAQMDLLAEATITPSGMDEELRCGYSATVKLHLGCIHVSTIVCNRK